MTSEPVQATARRGAAALPRRQGWTSTVFDRTAGAIVLVGVAVFVWAGSQHPDMGREPGSADADTYFEELAALIAHHHDWSVIHAGLLAGPLLWALGSTALVLRLHRWGERRYSSVGGAALGVGAALWAVAFVFAAFVLPAQAAAVNASNGETRLVAAAGLRSAQAVAFRLGLVALIAIGVAMAALAASILVSARFPVLRWSLGPAGLILGVWPALAWAIGVFQPSPFTSAAWTPTAILTSGWFLAVGVALLVAGEADASEPRPLPVRAGSDRRLVGSDA